MKFTAIDRQREIYLQGFAGKKQRVPASFAKLEKLVAEKISPEAFAYIAGGAGNETTIRANRNAFSNWRIVPRMLRDVGERDTTLTLFSKQLPAPLLLAPVGVLEMVNREADLAVARAAAQTNIPFIFSNQASKPMETCANAMNDSPRFFQLYWSKSNELVKSFVQRAEHCGCSGIVVTLDTTLLGWRTRDLDLAYLPFLEGKGIAQYTADPVFQNMIDAMLPVQQKRSITLSSLRGLFKMVSNYPGSGFFSKLTSGRPIKAVQQFIATYSNPSITWDHVKLLRQYTQLPIILKGILHADDARQAIDYGANGIIVSNHGGRQVDGAIATLEALPAIKAAIGNQIPILLDSGVRGGADMFKALALGANAVCIGRPYVYGLAIDGQAGVETVIRNMMADFELNMALAGCKNLAEITPDSLVKIQ